MAVILKRGSRGSSVKALQKALLTKGFSPGGVDGIFGLGTDIAVRALQMSEGLLVDGIVGQDTVEALNDKPVKKKRRTPKTRRTRKSSNGISRKRIFSSTSVNRIFPDAPKTNIKKYLPHVLRALEAEGLTETPMVLMALATIRAETAGFAPISEYKSRYNTSKGGHPFDLYDNRRDLGNRGKPDGERFRGRGFIQLTGRANYRRIGKKIGLGTRLEQNPELANDPKIAAKILAAFLGDKERKIKEALLDNDLKTARKLVNGGSHGLTQFRRCYKEGLKMMT